MPEEYENAIEWLDGQKTATVTVHSQKQKTALLRLAKAHPDKVKVVVHPRGNGGFLIVHLPVGWIQFRPPRTQKLTEEELARREAQIDRVNASRKQCELPI